MKKLILASASKGRMQLLKNIGFIPDKIIPADIDESFQRGEAPKDLAIRLARQKAEKVFEIAKKDTNCIILAGDTVVAVGRKIVDKALNDDDVRGCLKTLSGRNSRVYSAFCIIEVTSEDISKCKIIQKCGETRTKFKVLNKTDIEQMVLTKTGIGKAGGCAILGFSESFIITISGSLSNVIGLSTYHVRNALLSLGVVPVFDHFSQ